MQLYITPWGFLYFHVQFMLQMESIPPPLPNHCNSNLFAPGTAKLFPHRITEYFGLEGTLNII